VIYAVSALAVVSALLAVSRPSIWSLFAAAALNAAAGYAALRVYMGW